MRKFQTEVQITASNAGLSGLSFGRMTSTAVPTSGSAPLGVDASGSVVVATGDTYAIVPGTTPTATKYVEPQIRRAIGVGTTDANGRITVYLTSSGALAGTALFSSVLSIQLNGVYAGTDASAAPSFFVESISADRKTLLIRGTKGNAAIVALLASSVFLGAGVQAYFEVTGLI